MALQKTFTLPEGYDANYIRFDEIDGFSRSKKRATITFGLYVSKAAADAGSNFSKWTIRLNLNGSKFDQYFSNPVLSEADIIAQCYAAAKVERVDMWLGSGPGVSLDGVAMPSPLAGATDV